MTREKWKNRYQQRVRNRFCVASASSWAYDVLVKEGEVKALRETLLRQSRKRFKSAEQSIEASVNTITDLDLLKRMTERLLEVRPGKNC